MATKGSRPEMSWIESRQEYRKRKKIGTKKYDIYGKTKEEVREKVKQLQQEYELGLMLDNTTTFATYSTKWLKLKQGHISKGTQLMYLSVLTNYVLPVLSDFLLKDIRPTNIKEVMAKVSDKSNSIQSKTRITLNQIMESALADGLILKNPCIGIKAGGRRPDPKVPLTRRQQRILRVFSVENPLYIFVMLALYCGLRKEEAIGLLWKNVHVGDVPYLDVRTKVNYKGNVYSKELKSRAAYRTIPIPKLLADKLRQADKSKKFVLPAVKSDSYMPEKNFNRYWKKIVDAVGEQVNENGELIREGFHVHPHLLRHTYITELCASGMDIKKIQYLAGHETPEMTLRIYAHVVHNRPEDMIEAIDGIFDR